MTLRRLVTGVVVSVSAITLTVSLALALLALQLRSRVNDLGVSVESVRSAEALEVVLLRHRDLSVRAVRGEQGIAGALAQADVELGTALAHSSQLVQSAREEELLDELGRRVSQALETRHEALRATQGDGSPLAAPYEAALVEAQALVTLNVEHARATQRRAVERAHLGTLLGTASLLLLLGGVPMILFAIRSRVLRPLMAIRCAVARFRDGDHAARIPAGIALPELCELADDLNHMAERIQHQRELDAALLASVAHDLRNPLSALRIATASVSADRPLPAEERVRKVLDITRRQIACLDRMVGDLLDASGLEAGRLQLKLDRTDLRDVCRAVVELFRELSTAHDIALTVYPEPLLVRCDAARIEQVLSNLVTNSIKYSPKGGRIEMAAYASEGGVEIAVSDRGIGMSPEDVRQTEQPFWRAEAIRHAVPGLGLGLAITRALVHAHGGRVAVESGRGIGSTFRVWLPGDPALDVAAIFDINASRRVGA